MFVLAINDSYHYKHNKNKTCIVYLFVYIIYLIWLSSSSIWSPSREWSDTLKSSFYILMIFPSTKERFLSAKLQCDSLLTRPSKSGKMTCSWCPPRNAKSFKRQLLIQHSYTIHGHILGDSWISKVLRCQHSQKAQLESSHKPGYKTKTRLQRKLTIPEFSTKESSTSVLRRPRSCA